MRIEAVRKQSGLLVNRMMAMSSFFSLKSDVVLDLGLGRLRGPKSYGKEVARISDVTERLH